MTSGTALLAATALHFGFQVTVTAIVYPALARVAAPGWAAAHRAHTRAIMPMVAVVYGALGLAGGWALLSVKTGWTLVGRAAPREVSDQDAGGGEATVEGAAGEAGADGGADGAGSCPSRCSAAIARSTAAPRSRCALP